MLADSGSSTCVESCSASVSSSQQSMNVSFTTRESCLCCTQIIPSSWDQMRLKSMLSRKPHDGQTDRVRRKIVLANLIILDLNT